MGPMRRCAAPIPWFAPPGQPRVRRLRMRHSQPPQRSPIPRALHASWVWQAVVRFRRWRSHRSRSAAVHTTSVTTSTTPRRLADSVLWPTWSALSPSLLETHYPLAIRVTLQSTAQSRRQPCGLSSVIIPRSCALPFFCSFALPSTALDYVCNQPRMTEVINHSSFIMTCGYFGPEINYCCLPWF